MWEIEMCDVLVSLYKSGKTLNEISKIINKTELSIYRKLKRINKFGGRIKIWKEDEELELRNLVSGGNSILEISRIMNRSDISIGRKCKRLKIKVNKRTIDWVNIQQSYNDGLTYKDLIKRFKISTKTIQKAKREGLLKLRSQKDAWDKSISCGRRKIKDKNIDNYKEYRDLCLFKFNPYNFKSEFNFKLVDDFGWYKATNSGDNPAGVSRDHKLSVKYGYDNKIDPMIISHPANCELILQSMNSRKNSKSSISIDELLIKINEWDIKYGQVTERISEGRQTPLRRLEPSSDLK